MTLVDEIPAPERGWLGIVSAGPADSADGAEPGVRVGVLTGSPAAEAGLPERCVISEINGTEVSSPRQLERALRDLAAGATTEISFVTGDDSEELQTLPVVAQVWDEEDRTELVPEVMLIRQQTLPPSLPEWTQEESDLGEDWSVWTLGPKEKPDGIQTGLVIVLHDGEPVRDAVIQQWRDVCVQHQLILAVVWHEYSLPLDSLQTLGGVMKEVSQRGSIDADRATLVTGESHSSFVMKVLLNPRIQQLRSGVFVGCRPLTGGLSLAGFQAKPVSMLLFPEQGELQAQALTASTVRRLKTAGAAITLRGETEFPEERLPADEIARWLLLKKIR